MIIKENIWPPYYTDQYGLWEIYHIPLSKPSSPTAYCAGLELAFGTKWVFRTEGEAIFDRQVTATGPMCHEFDSRGDSFGGTGLALVVPSNYDPFKNLGGGCSPLINNGSNPVNAANGNKYQHEVDYLSQTGQSFSRYYNSLSSMPVFDSISRQKIWTSNYDSYVRLQTYANSVSYGSVFVYKPNGNIFIFNPDGNGGYISNDASNLDKLEHLAGGGWRLLIDNDNSIENYDIAGKLISISSRNGRMQTLGYDTSGRLTAVTNDTGQTLTFTYDGASRISTMTDPDGRLYLYAYDTKDNLISVTYPDGKIRTYHYNEQAYTNNAYLPNVLTGITDENDVRYTLYTYDASGRAIASEHAGGTMRYTFSYNADRTTTIVDPAGASRIHQFQFILGEAKSTGQSQPAGSGCNAASSAITYDANGNVASRADFNGNKTCYAYDLTRNLEIARVEGLGSGSSCPADLLSYTPATNSSERKILTTWHANFRLPTLIAESKRETSYVYDTHGNVTQYRLKDTATNATRTWTTSYSYHPSIPGVILQKTENGARTDVTDITTTDYYAPDAICAGGHKGCRAQIASITNALGHVTQITRYNAHGQPEEIIDPNGLTATFAYDVRQRLLSRTVGTEITNYQYDNAGQLKKIILPDNSFLSYTYDAAHRLTDMADNLGNRVHYTLDNMGNRTKEELFDPSNNLAQTQQREYDALSRLWKDIGAQNQITQYQYDAQGNLKQIADPLLYATNFQFDTRNRLKQTTDAANGLTQHTLDALDQITQISDPRDIDTTYAVNGFGDITQEISADRGTTTYTFDAAGNLKTVTDARGVKHTYTWDALNRPTKRTHTTVTGVPTTAAITWGYDTGTHGIGRLTGMTDESGSTSFSYDLHGRLLSKTQIAKIGTINYTQMLGYQYDSFGRLSDMTYPSGTQVSTTYGTDGRPTEIRVNGNLLLSNIAYLPFGEPKSWVWGNNQAYTRSFDSDGRLRTHPVGSDTRTLTYDAASRITNTADTNPVYSRTYDYDARNHLVSQSDNTGFKLWGYDANSNRTNTQIGATNYLYTIATNSNRLQSVAGPVIKTYTYDAAGNPLSDGATTFTWNAAGKLSTTINNAKTHTYKTNGLDQRITKNGPLSSKFFFFYDPAGQLIGEYRNNSSTATPTDDWLVRQETIWLEDIPVAVIRKPTETSPIQVYYIQADHLNTPRVIVNQGNNPVWRWENTHPFGANLPEEDPDGNAQLFEYQPRFPGQYFDKETNLHYNYFRYYEPETGRYISPDPIGLAGGINTYGYVEQNPLSFVDPRGLIRYNAPAPRTVPVTGVTLIALQCVESCLQQSTGNQRLDLLITGGAETTGHSKNSHHSKGQACDIASAKFNPGLTNENVGTCAVSCGFGGGQYEMFLRYPNRDHWHLQLEPGNGVPKILPGDPIPIRRFQ